MATHCRFHGEGACHVSAMNWKVCKTDTEFFSSITSLEQTARCQDELDAFTKFLDELFRYGKGPIIWTTHPSRHDAPLYLVSHHHRVPRHSRYRLWGCRACGWTTNQLWHASEDFDECLAGRREEVEFLLLMLRLLKSFQLTNSCSSARISSTLAAFYKRTLKPLP